ncbi:hypothetical protein Tco_1402966 [Tanacetum coccineum]
MAGPITKEYIFATSKSFISNDTNGKMIEKNFIEIEGTFLLKIRDNTFHGNKGEDVFKHINSFVEVVEPLKIRGLSHDRFRLSVFPTSLSGAAKEWFTNECIGTISTWDDLVEKFVLKFYNLCKHEEHEETNDENDPDVSNDVPEIFKINGGLFHFDTPLCIAFEEFNHLLKIDSDLFTYEIQTVKTYDEYAQELNNKTQDSKGTIPSKTAVDAKIAIQEMAEYSQKWHNGTSSRARSTETSDGLAAIQAKLNNLGREINKVNEKVYAAQVGCELCKGPRYTKDYPQKEEGKALEEAYYT